MTLFNIAQKNMKNNFSNYFLYFASMIFSIVIYFTFVSLKYDKTILATSEGSPKISAAFSAASVVLMIFVAIFIWYSNSFFTRKRKKEVALYSLLGVRKKQIGKMLFYENFTLGIIALAIGIALGSILSKYFVSLLMKVMGHDTLVNFSVSFAAIVNTIIVFMIITLFTSFQGYRVIYRFKLIDLFQAEKQGEPEPKASFFLALLSILLIGIGYWIALQNLVTSSIWKTLGMAITPLIILATVIIGTYLLFNSVTVYLLKLAKKNKKSYWNGINIIGISQLLYRIKGNARTLTIIAVLSATTLSAVGTSYSSYYNNRHNTQIANPNSFMFTVTDNTVSNKVKETISNDIDHQIMYHETIPTIEVNVDTTNLYNYGDMPYTLISASDFNKLANNQNRKDSLSLKGNQATALDAAYMEGYSPKYIGTEVSFKVNEFEQKIAFTDLKKYSVLNSNTVFNVIVVSDELFTELVKVAPPLDMEVYKIKNEDDAEKLTNEIKSFLPDEAKFSNFYSDYSSGLETSGLMIFMSGFLGLVFLAATGSIIYFKQLTEATSDKGRYEILLKIGVKKKEIYKSIAKQNLFIFAIPLLAGIAHSAVALTALSNLLQTNLVVPVAICIGVYTGVYIIYYFLTVKTYYKIVLKTK
ncbi:ABC transporter permease [Lysinibacillus sp. NPDC093197]|uniref:ABC transporter permease n=1 Tax=Lysinibacillus sp. NPDC093197 TaxID=3364132 RepID=UPI003813AF8B